MNYSINLTDFNLETSQCMVRGVIDPNCVYNHICGSISGHFRLWGFILLASYLIIDMVLPLAFVYILPRFKARGWCLWFWNPEWQQGALDWFKGHLLFGFVVLVFYQLVL
jgi:hypothetical protein